MSKEESAKKPVKKKAAKKPAAKKSVTKAADKTGTAASASKPAAKKKTTAKASKADKVAKPASTKIVAKKSPAAKKAVAKKPPAKKPAKKPVKRTKKAEKKLEAEPTQMSSPVPPAEEPAKPPAEIQKPPPPAPPQAETPAKPAIKTPPAEERASKKTPSARKIGGAQVIEKKVRTFSKREFSPPRSGDSPPPPPSAPIKTSPPQNKPEGSAEASRKPQPLDPASLYRMQVERQKQQEKDQQERDERERKSASSPEKPPAARPAPAAAPKKYGTIRIDPKALSVHKKKRRQNISRREALQKTAESQQGFSKPTDPIIYDVKIPDAISVAQLAAGMSIKSGVVIRRLMDHGMTVTANELLDKETAWIIVEELGHKPIDAPLMDEEEELLKEENKASDLQYESRAPVVTVMGHVDHGKTSLLDHIRKTRVAPSESGGITQHIGAYRVDTPLGPVSFIDTPGHELFTEMRSRGAKITDIVVLVVAADDGVKPQTVEAINHAKAAGVPLIVAANKMDKPEANLDRVKRELSENDVLPEDWGGDAMVVPISAQTGEGIERLLDALAIQADLLEFKAPVNVSAKGIVVESRIDRGRGIVATVIVTQGVLKTGDIFLCGTESGRVRAMWDAATPSLKEARPSMPVEIQGLSGVPKAGVDLLVVGDERKARQVANLRQSKIRAKRLTHNLSTEGGDHQSMLDAAASQEDWKELNVVVKTDVEGSREAITTALRDVSGKKAGVKVIHSGVGTVTESDIYLAQTSGGVVVSFNVRPDSRVRKFAESRGVRIIVGNVVYELMEQVRQSVLNLLPPIIEETIVGVADVLQIFNISRVGQVAGCRVSEGAINSRAHVRVVRDGVGMYEGRIVSLRHFKEEVAEVRSGTECGLSVGKFNDIKVGDKIEAIERTETAAEM